MEIASGASKCRTTASSLYPGRGARISASGVRLLQRIEQMFAYGPDEYQVSVEATQRAFNVRASGYDPLVALERGRLEREIVGALRSSIAAHGPITWASAPSAGKRVIAALRAGGIFRDEEVEPPNEPTQTTPSGQEIPIPTRGEFDDLLRKVAPPAGRKRPAETDQPREQSD
ncbi:MAG: hypothetical protein JO206_05420 [Solirubrobacterales bacterium]|nr:hypothetical protein [Solirubrobacterales bacterium]